MHGDSKTWHHRPLGCTSPTSSRSIYDLVCRQQMYCCLVSNTWYTWKEYRLVKSNIWPRKLMLHIASRVCRRYGFSLHFTGQYLLDVLVSVNTAVHTQRLFQQSPERSQPAVLYEICCVSVMTQHRAGQVVIKILFPERFLMSSLSLTLNLFPEAL